MIALTCLFGKTGGVTPPVNPGTIKGRRVADIFAEASQHDIDLAVDDSQLSTDLDPGQPASTAASLHKGLRTLTQNPSQGGPVTRFGLIYARQYQNHPEVLGLMFDRGFSSVDDPNTAFQKVPREGCAVFIDSIGQYRNFDPVATAAEIEFTTIHELGHVFNLEHTAGENFLATSIKSGPFAEGYYQFTGAHKAFLQQCSTCRCIQPGGSRFGDRAELGKSFDPYDGAGSNAPVAAQGRSPLSLELKLPQPDFWYCEPVELEIRIRLSKSARTAQSIPDTLDPGHGDFTIWIEEPNGERRPYRSPKFFCARPRRRSLAPGTSFVRDLSIFGQAGGYTFRRAGVHRVHATFQVAPGTVLASNTVECELREPSPHSREFARLAPLLRQGAQLFYYRSSPDLKGAEALVGRISRLAPRTTTAAACRYALGRALAAKAERSDTRSRIYAQGAIHHLTKAGESGRLGRHSATIAGEWAKAMDTRLRGG